MICTDDCTPNSCGSHSKNALSMIGSSDAVYTELDRFMLGMNEYVFNKNWPHMIERIFLKDAYNFLNRNEEEFFRNFVSEAGIVTDKIINNEELPYCDMSNIMMQFDRFLGSYGV